MYKDNRININYSMRLLPIVVLCLSFVRADNLHWMQESDRHIKTIRQEIPLSDSVIKQIVPLRISELLRPGIDKETIHKLAVVWEIAGRVLYEKELAYGIPGTPHNLALDYAAAWLKYGVERYQDPLCALELFILYGLRETDAQTWLQLMQYNSLSLYYLQKSLDLFETYPLRSGDEYLRAFLAYCWYVNKG